MTIRFAPIRSSDARVRGARRCARVSDRGVRALVVHCRHLNSMQLEGCRELSGWAIHSARHAP